MIQLYGGVRTRAGIIQWYLDELNLPFEPIDLDLKAGAQHQPEFLALNPFGKVPVLVDGTVKVWESGAILLYLAQQYGPELSPPTQAQVAQWVLFANATLGPGVFGEGQQQAPRLLGALDQILADRSYLVGDALTVADVAVGAVLAFIPVFLSPEVLASYPQILAYLGRLGQRPAFQRALKPSP